MDQLIVALGPVFVAGFAVQQFLELLTTVPFSGTFDKYKKLFLGIASLAVGLLLAGCVREFRVLHAIKIDSIASWLDVSISAFVLSAGTEGVNSILKFFKYTKEDKKASAASKEPKSGLAANVAAGVPSTEALERMNLK